MRGWAKIRGFPKWMQTLVINLIILRVFQSTVSDGAMDRGDGISLYCCCCSLEKIPMPADERPPGGVRST